MLTSPRTNSAFQREQENEYQDLSFKAEEPRKSATEVERNNFFVLAG